MQDSIYQLLFVQLIQGNDWNVIFAYFVAGGQEYCLNYGCTRM